MIQKTIKSRIVHKHDLEAHWMRATSFVPLQGELIIYDIEIDADGNTLTLPEGRTTPYDYERFKIGDGITNVNELPFALEHTHSEYITKAELDSKGYLTEHQSLKTINGESLVGEGDITISGSSGGASIIYATEKPSTPQQAIYVITEDEVVKAEVYNEGVNITPDGGYCEIVDVLPENPQPVITLGADMSLEYMYLYYHAKENEGYAYIDETAASLLEAPMGWLPASAMGGVISTSVDDMPESGQAILLTTQPKTRVYVPLPDGTFLELTSGIRTRFDEKSGTVSITEM